jgi:hypothetical protein
MSMLSVLGITIVAALLLAGCTISGSQALVGSGNRVTVEKDLSGFSKIQASSAFQVGITQSEVYSVVITVDEKVEPYLDVTVQGDTLRIAVRPGLTLAGAAFPLQAKVSMPRLTGLELSGASRATVSGFKSADGLNANLSGASGLDGQIEAGDVRFQVSGASRVALSGKGQKMVLELSGASQGNLENFVVSEAVVEASGASRATVNVTGKLDADVSGASALRYTGNPTMGSVKSSGASTIQPK